MIHGTATSYNKQGCRCDECRCAHAAYVRGARERRSATPPPSHGLNGYTNYGCRCEVCREAGRVARQEARAR